VRTQTFALLAAVSISQVFAAGPELTNLNPPGGQRGTAIKLTLQGYGLTGETKILSNMPGSFTRLTPANAGKMAGRQLPFLVEIRPDVPVGLYPIRVETQEGISNILLFSVGAFPEITEAESEDDETENANDGPESAQALKTPVIVNGTLEGAERDMYRISAQAGDRVVFEVEARRAGSALDPALHIFDAEGRPIGRNNDARGLGVDPRLAVVFEKAGDYFVEVYDARFSEQDRNFYRLKIAEFAFAEALFPLGWQRGGEVEVELSGGNLSAPVNVRPDIANLPDKAGFAEVRVPGAPGALPMRFLVGDGPETMEPDLTPSGTAALEPNTVINGRISQPGEKDRYRLAVSPGENWFIELQSAELGTSELYGTLELYDTQGEPVAEAGYEQGAQDPNVVLARYRPNSRPTIALEIPSGIHELIVEVGDLLGQGGPGHGYRLTARPQPPDFLLTLDTPFINIPLNGSALVTVTAERRGFLKPIQLSIHEPPDDLMVEGGFILAESDTSRIVRKFQKGILTITPKPGAKRRKLDLSVWGEAVADDGTVIRRRARGPGMVTAVGGRKQNAFTAPWLDLELPAAVGPRLPAVLEVLTPRHVRLGPGTTHEVKWSFLSREDGIAPPEKVEFAGSTGGQIIGTRPKVKEKRKDRGTIVARTTERTTVTKLDVALSAQVKINGREETIYSPMIRFDIVQGYSIESAADVTSIRPGGTAELAGVLRREPEFTSAVNLAAQNLPLGVECEPLDLSPEESEFRLPCHAEKTAEPGDYEIQLISRSTLAGPRETSVPYTIGPFNMRMVVTEKAAQSERASR
jgi:hypothetical protein